jgi:hypothetical protein
MWPELLQQRVEELLQDIVPGEGQPFALEGKCHYIPNKKVGAC